MVWLVVSELENISRKRGAVLTKGRITLETPDEFAGWLAGWQPGSCWMPRGRLKKMRLKPLG